MTAAHEKPEWAQSRHEKKNAERVAQGLKPKPRILIWVVLAIVVLGIAALIIMPMLQPAPAPVETAEAAPVARQLLPAEVTEIAPQLLRQTVKVTGTLVPGEQSEVAAQASGRVLSVALRPGDRVAEGDILVQIDRANLELQVSQQRATADATRAQLESAQATLQRTEQLASQGLASPSTLQETRSSAAALEANLAALESGVATAELALSNATVTSPVTGIIAARSVEPGQTINAGTALFTIVNLENVEFQASASVTSGALVSAGQAVEVTVTGLGGQNFDGTVTRVNPVAAEGTRTVPIYIDLANETGALRGGMFATGFITVAEKADAIAVPATAIREDADGQFVLVMGEDGTLARQAVEAGDEWDRGRIVEVTGLEPGMRVVGAALTELNAGDAYELVEG